jgi:hypothetical protein
VLLVAVSLDLSSFESSRLAMAVFSTLLVVAAALSVLVGFPLVSSSWLSINVPLAIGVGGVLLGISIHLLFVFMTIVNSCGFGVGFPYRAIEGCG